MVMTYGRVKKGVGELAPIAMDLATTGISATAGLFTGKWIGQMVEQFVKPSPVSDTDKMIAFVSNAVPKGMMALLAYKYLPGITGGDKESFMNNVTTGVTIGIAGSIGIDAVERLLNNGMPGNLMLSGNKASEERIQALLRENSALKQNIQRLSSRPQTQAIASGGSPIVNVQPVQAVKAEPPPNRPLERRYEFTNPGEQIPGVQYEKRPIDKRHQFVSKDVTRPDILANGFGFQV